MPFRRGPLGLDLFTFFIAGIQAGFGPFVAVFLTDQGWSRTDLGIALSIAGIVGLAGQVPGGMLIDAVRDRRRAAGWAVAVLGIAVLLLSGWPQRLPVFLAVTLQSLASCVLGPAIAAISLALAGHALFSERLGRNMRFASIGNAAASLVMGVLGSLVAERAVFWLTAALVVPTLWSLRLMGRLPVPEAATATASATATTTTTTTTTTLGTEAGAERKLPSRAELRALLTDRRLVVFALACAMFHLASAPMLPLAAASVTRQAGDYAELLVGVAVVVPQAVVVLVSVWIGRAAEARGRRAMLLLGWGMLPLRGAMLALMPSPWLFPAAQALSGVSDAVFGIMMPLVAADLTRGTTRFNLCIGIFSLMMVLGGTMSTTLAGLAADFLGEAAAFLLLALAGLAGTAMVWLLMPETKPLPTEAVATA